MEKHRRANSHSELSPRTNSLLHVKTVKHKTSKSSSDTASRLKVCARADGAAAAAFQRALQAWQARATSTLPPGHRDAQENRLSSAKATGERKQKSGKGRQATSSAKPSAVNA